MTSRKPSGAVRTSILNIGAAILILAAVVAALALGRPFLLLSLIHI